MINGKKVAVRLTINEDRVIIGEEQRNSETFDFAAQDPSGFAGVISKPTADGRGKMITSVAPQTQEAMKFFIPQHHKCWFEGCEDLQAEYLKELEEMEKDPNCPKCKKGQLIKKYLPQVIAAVQQ